MMHDPVIKNASGQNIMGKALISPAMTKSTKSCNSTVNDSVIQDIFRHAKTRWIDDPVISQWREPSHHVYDTLSDANNLYHEWESLKTAPFSNTTCPLWSDTGRTLAKIGLPWHNNQVNMPDQIDTSWPFHFKKLEAQLIKKMGARVGNPSPSGYVSNYHEANCYCIRALQQELRKTCPTEKPVLVYDRFDHQLINSFQNIFGIEVHHVRLSSTREFVMRSLLGVTSNRARPIIFAASVGNFATEDDKLGVIAELSLEFALVMHLNAFRSFDYITTMSAHKRRRTSAESFVLKTKSLHEPIRADDGRLIATSIVASALNQPFNAPAVALTPLLYGGKAERVAYIRSLDLTLAGSRDAIAPLWLSLYEIRLGRLGIQRVCNDLAGIRSRILRGLQSQGMIAHASLYCLDIVVDSFSTCQKLQLLKLGGRITATGKIILAIHTGLLSSEIFPGVPPEFEPQHGKTTPDKLSTFKAFLNHFPIPRTILAELEKTIQTWKTITRTTAGYPLHMGSLSALGPVIGRFWDLDIPKDWTETTSNNLLASRLEAFGVSSADTQYVFKAAFTNGSTMGNRCGIHTAFAQYPDATIYLSTETHYSVMKTLRDCDTISNLWSAKACQYSHIPCLPNGSICVEALVRQVLLDQKRYDAEGRKYDIILFANIGTTFVGARDDLSEIYKQLQLHGIGISHIHADGAFDFGFDNCGIKMGRPGTLDTNGIPLVQGITISHHKALGQNVSGEVLCFSPGSPIVGQSLFIEPRIIFETWLYDQIYKPEDRRHLLSYCRENALLLETGLEKLGLETKRNNQSPIVVMERPAAWIIEEFSLRPERDWVHFITMPHISLATISVFLDRVECVEKACNAAFTSVEPLVRDLIGRRVEIKRIRCRSTLAQTLLQPPRLFKNFQDGCHADLEDLIRSSIRGAFSVAVIDDEGRIQLVLLAESHRDHSIQIKPLLINNAFVTKIEALHDIRSQLMDLMARYLKAEIKHCGTSQHVYTFA